MKFLLRFLSAWFVLTIVLVAGLLVAQEVTGSGNKWLVVNNDGGELLLGTQSAKDVIIATDQGGSPTGWKVNSTTGDLSSIAGTEGVSLPLGLFGDGTPTTPSISFNNDTDTGIYRAGTNQIEAVTGGVRNWSISSDGTMVKAVGHARIESNATGLSMTIAGSSISNAPRVEMYGDTEATNPGDLKLFSGNDDIELTAEDDITLAGDDSTDIITLSGGTTVDLTVADNQITVADGTDLVHAGTTDIGWVPKSATAQTCNDICTYGCVVGLTTGSAFSDCSNAITGTCLCAGPS